MADGPEDAAHPRGSLADNVVHEPSRPLDEDLNPVVIRQRQGSGDYQNHQTIMNVRAVQQSAAEEERFLLTPFASDLRPSIAPPFGLALMNRFVPTSRDDARACECPASSSPRSSHRAHLSDNVDMVSSEGGKKRVAVIGLGMFGAALGTRLAEAGYAVVFGSKSGKARYELREGSEVKSLPQALFFGDVIVLALPDAAIPSFCKEYCHAMEKKIVVDVSNPGLRPGKQSMGEVVAGLLPHSLVVKAFNTSSAYRLRGTTSAGDMRVVEMCGNSTRAKSHIATMIYDMGYTPVDLGGIRAAKFMEAKPMQFFSHWKSALSVTAFIFVPLLVYVIVRDIVLDKRGWSHFPASGAANIAGWMSICILSATYLPGIIATVHQKPLPEWLIHWLDIRKQLGLIAAVLALVHTLAVLTVLTPHYKHLTDLFLKDGTMNAVGETTVLVGLAALLCLALLSLTSLPSVGASLSWKEWDFVQKRIGWLSVILSLAHVIVFGAPSKAWTKPDSWPRHLPPSSLLAAFACALVLFLKTLLALRRMASK